MKCHFCGEELIWGADFNSEDFGHDEGGIVATLHCPNCDAHYEATLMDNDFYEKRYKDDSLSETIIKCEDKKIKDFLIELQMYRNIFNGEEVK